MANYTLELERIVTAIEQATGINAKWTTKAARVSNPITGSADRNVAITDGKNRVVITDFANGADPKDILSAVGLSIGSVYYDKLTPDQRSHRRAKKTRQQIETECCHAWLVLSQIPVMKEQGLTFSDEDAEAIDAAKKIVSKYGFDQRQYEQIETARAARAEAKRLDDCDRALNESYDTFMVRGGKYE